MIDLIEASSQLCAGRVNDRRESDPICLIQIICGDAVTRPRKGGPSPRDGQKGLDACGNQTL
jgi:hypothetical protein